MVQRDSFSDFADAERPRIAGELARSLDSLPAGCPPPLAEAMRYSLLSEGKRVRPLLTLMAADACGGDIAAALPAACALEMVHVYSLIHDDLPAMDDDDLRRGQPTNHVVFGEGEAILAGDALLTLAFETLARGVRPPEAAAECVSILASAAGAAGMVGGQSDDLRGVEGERTAQHLESIDERKTGALLEAALLLGAIVAGGNEAQKRALQRYGRSIGIAFQIRDDLLDAESSAEDAGKATGKDAARGKLTYPSLLGVERSRERMAALVAEAEEALAVFGSRAEHLRAFARYVVERVR